MNLLGVGTPAMWIGFFVFVFAMLALDLGVFHRDSHTIRFREAMSWSAVWVALSLVFSGIVYLWFGVETSIAWLTGYVVEKSLAIDNIFVFVAVFGAFAVPPQYQHRVLFWGVLGALLMRAIFIGLGAALLQRFDWILYVFGVILIVTGIRMLAQRHETIDVEHNPVYRFLRRRLPSTSGYRGDHFFVREGGRWLATPLFFVLVIIEVADVVFAVDSIPAIFAITTDPFIVFTSNIFAILGLRSMYFLLADIVPRFRHLKVGLSAVLVFVGAKMLLSGVIHIPTLVSLSVILLFVIGSIVWSLLSPPSEATPDGRAPSQPPFTP